MLTLLLSSMAFAIAVFGLCILLGRPRTRSTVPLIITLCCFAFLASGNIVFALLPNLIPLFISLLPLFFFALPPSLWMYHQGLTTISPKNNTKPPAIHFLPLILCLPLSVSIALLPTPEMNQLFFSDDPVTSFHGTATAYGFFIAILVWGGSSMIYVAKIVVASAKYHIQVRSIYSNETGKRMTWIAPISGLVVFIWLYGLAVLATDNQLEVFGISETGVFVLLLITVWCLTAFGLEQKPGFEDVALKLTGQKESASDPIKTNKYARSALSKEDFLRISGKLLKAMEQDKLYLDSNLNLFKLAEHTHIPSQYLSQTLTQYMQTSFFEFINKTRIEAAIPLLNNNNQTVLAIAEKVGFNSRSSFYKAFKAETGMTPSQYKNQHHSS